jgi:hypothetical protein
MITRRTPSVTSGMRLIRTDHVPSPRIVSFSVAGRRVLLFLLLTLSGAVSAMAGDPSGGLKGKPAATTEKGQAAA